MPINKSDNIWFNGELVPWDEAKIHVMSHALHYGSSVFEGIRAYDTATGPAVWLLNGHLKRLFESAKIYRMEIPYSFDEIKEAILEAQKWRAEQVRLRGPSEMAPLANS